MTIFYDLFELHSVFFPIYKWGFEYVYRQTPNKIQCHVCFWSPIARQTLFGWLNCHIPWCTKRKEWKISPNEFLIRKCISPLWIVQKSGFRNSSLFWLNGGKFLAFAVNSLNFFIYILYLENHKYSVFENKWTLIKKKEFSIKHKLIINFPHIVGNGNVWVLLTI